uniref:Sulfur globule protein n=1 Tax=Candidatus Kentrum sp. FW TaxID=2126338 RepID=A0A450T9J9_9GAMM|nr:MAG: hypothetical protein BECKFW1821A_GA0114235_100555 [Candidatus Kentron sp. FW]VFJ63352.1 MAG: hypothetical protein BECKFW1821B_GA0114236_10825 [Candidatus Kentron sp. FW]
MRRLAKLVAAIALVGMMALPFQSAQAFWGGGYWDDGYGWGPYGRGWHGYGYGYGGYGGPWGYGGYGYPGYYGYPGWGYGGYGSWGHYPPVAVPLVPAPTAPAKAKTAE